MHLTVSSLKDGYLELNWITECSQHDIKPEFIALYDSNPKERNVSKSLKLVEIIHSFTNT